MKEKRMLEELGEYAKYLEACQLCPRKCGVNRLKGERGLCRCGLLIRIARADLHMWEEPCISGKEGSGAVFFSGCNLRCIFCQNYEIADRAVGQVCTSSELAEHFLRLEEKGANNINLVSASPYIPQLIPAIRMARERGLQLPFVFNCGGYENPEALALLNGLISVYLPDFKYMDKEVARAYSKAEDYPDVAKEALQEMVRQIGYEAHFNEKGMMDKGIIVRHLLMPGHVKNAKAVLDYLYHSYGNQIYISILQQYTPILSNPLVREDSLLSRRVTKREYQKVLDYALELGIENAFIQERGVAEESFIPAWDLV